MKELSNWTQVNPNVWVKRYPCGTLAVARAVEDRRFTTEAFATDGEMCRFPFTGQNNYGTLDEMKNRLDKKYDPQPDHILGGEANGCDITVYFHKGRAAIVRQSASTKGSWYWELLSSSETSSGIEPTRADAELAARNCVLEGAGR